VSASWYESANATVVRGRISTAELKRCESQQTRVPVACSSSKEVVSSHSKLTITLLKLHDPMQVLVWGDTCQSWWLTTADRRFDFGPC
jgi:hypothetical protein